MASQDPILIIGGGLGGLTLARALQKQGVPFRIFERSPEHDGRPQGWAISLHSWMVADLLSAVSDDEAGLRSCCTTHALDLRSELAMYSLGGADARMDELVRIEDTPERPWIRADRDALRRWLLRGLPVEWGRRFVAYETGERGVTARFEDGTLAEGAALIGADGIQSRVRNQLIPSEDVRPKQIPMGIIIGELEATKDQYQRWLKMGRSFYAGNDSNRRLFVGLKSVSSDRETARYYWLFSWHDQEAAKPGYWTANASREELHAYTMNHLDGLHPEFTEPIRATPVEGMLQPPLLMRDMLPPELPYGRVTLLGDAVHPMIPFRGEGGNMAMADSIKLAKMLGAMDETTALEALFKDYKAEMRERMSKSVLGSRAAVNVAVAM